MLGRSSPHDLRSVGRRAGHLAPLGLLLVLFSFVATPTALASITTAMGIGSPTVVASGLDNPRGMSFGPDGALYITEAGGTGDASNPCGPGPEPGETFCASLTGAITRVANGRQHRIASRLDSVGTPPGSFPASGPNGPEAIEFSPDGTAYVLFGLGLNGALRTSLGPDASDLGKLFKLGADGSLAPIADLVPYEDVNNPAGNPPPQIQSNPTGMVAKDDHAVVVDAAANDLLRVGYDGSISTMAAFPLRQFQLPDGSQATVESVPDAVAQGPDGAYYISELTGFPFYPGSARLWRVVRGQAPTVVASGLTLDFGVAFDKQGRLYVLQFARDFSLQTGFDPPGTVSRINPDGTQTTIVSGLNAPTAMTFGSDGNLYISVNGDQIVPPGATPSGEVVCIPLNRQVCESDASAF